MDWGFYGRRTELNKIKEILERRRWFFAKITGRRRIGKTRLIQKALEQIQDRPTFYAQIPDSAPAGVVAQIQDQMEVFRLDPAKFPPPKSLLDIAKLIASLIRAGFIVTLDEFQYFVRPKLKDFCSFLQAEIDKLSQEANVQGGLFVLGSIHTDMAAILEERAAPLYNRTTHEISVSHWEIESLLELFRSFDVYDPQKLLFLWNLFEGVPKFYRDCFEQDVLSADRKDLLRKMFFESSSPLKNEADNWFLKELHGRYDAILKYIARNAGCTNSDLEAHIRNVTDESEEQVGGHLKILITKFGIIEKRLPILSQAKQRKGRYYISDNFLRSWLAALSAPVSAVAFSPMPGLLQQADDRLKTMEGYGLEKLVGVLYEERSRKGVGDFHLTERVAGFWDRSEVEIDLVALDADARKIRFGTCKRSEAELLGSVSDLKSSAARFLNVHRVYRDWTIEYVALSPVIPSALQQSLRHVDVLAQDFDELFEPLLQ